MNTQGLQNEISRFENIIRMRLPQHPAGRRVALALRELYATKSAAAILRSVHALCPEGIENASSPAQEEGQFSLGSRLPSIDAVQHATPGLLKAIALQNGNQAVKALAEMGIFTLCPTPEQLFGRLECCVGWVIGRARLIPLLELAILATQLGAYDKVVSYLADAQALAPEPPELHDLHTVAGIVALAAGQVEEAKKELAESVRVCREGEYARLTCSIRAFNLMLAEKLLEHGEKAAVLKYLEQCRCLWSYAAKQITSWIEAIRNEQKPDFLAPSIRTTMDKPATKMHDLTIRSIFLTGTSDSEIQNPNERPLADVGEIRAKYKRDIAAALRGKLGTEKN